MPKSTTSTKTANTKTKKTTETATTVVAESAPVKTVEPTVTLAPVTTTVVEQTATATTTPVESTEDSNTEVLFNKLLTQFQDIQSVMKTLHSNLKVLQKEVLKEKKEFKKKEVKQNAKKNGKKSNVKSGFAKPNSISSDLATFLGLPSDALVARTEVTSKVIAYIKEHNLQNPERKKEIIPDAKLSAILQPGPNDVIQFFNLQTYLKKHFVGSATTTATSTSAPTVV